MAIPDSEPAPSVAGTPPTAPAWRRRAGAVPLAAMALLLLGVAGFASRAIEEDGERHAKRQIEALLDLGERSVRDRYRWGSEAAALVLSEARVTNTFVEILASDRDAVPLPPEVDSAINDVLRDTAWPYFWLIRPPGTIVTAFESTFEGFEIQPQYRSTTAGSTLARTMATGRAAQAPLRSLRTRPSDVARSRPSILISQCRRIGDEATPGAFCVATDPRDGLFLDLRGLWYGETGDAWLVDPSGRLRSPSRHEPPAGSVPDEPTQISPYRPMIASRPDGEASDAALLPPVAAALRIRDAVPVARYIGVDGLEQFGGARWLPELGVALVVEARADELLETPRYAMAWVRTFAALVMLALFVLGVTQWLARRDLERSNAVMGSLFAAAPEAMAIFDADGQPVRDNGRWAAWREEGLDAGMPELLAALRLHNAGRAVHGVTSMPVRFRDETGRERHLAATVFPLARSEGPGDDSNELVGYGMIAREITARMEMARAEKQRRHELEAAVHERTQQLSAAKDLAESAVQAREFFLASIGHEIRTPISAILGLSRLAIGTVAEPKAIDAFSRVQRAGEQLLRLVNDILDFSVMRSGALNITPAPLDVAVFVERLADVGAHLARERGVAFELDLDVTVPAVIHGDAMRLEQVLVNLLTNAFKFTESGRVLLDIRVVPTPVGVAMAWAVEDTGIGIPEQDRARIFEPFLQIDVGSARSRGGAGLGLAISKGLVERMGGLLYLRSAVGRGSRFEVFMPLSAEEAAAARVDWGNGQGRLALLEAPDRRTWARLASQLQAARLVPVDDDGEVPDLIVQAGPADRRAAVPSGAPVLRLAGEPGIRGGVGVLTPLRLRSFLAGLDARTAAPEAPVLPSIGADRGPVLVVDDDDIGREVLVDSLRAMGVAAAGAANAAQALGMLRLNRYAVALIDLHMPGMDGPSLARAIRADPRYAGLRLVACSATLAASEIQAARDAGLVEAIGKPYSLDALRDLLVATADRRDARDGTLPTTEGALRAGARRALEAADLDVSRAVDDLGGSTDIYVDVLRRIAAAGTLQPGPLRDLLAVGAPERAAEALHLAVAHAGRIGAFRDLALLREAEQRLRRGEVDGPAIEAALRRLARIADALPEACGALAGD